MTSHTPQPPAGDDLVARIADHELIETIHQTGVGIFTGSIGNAQEQAKVQEIVRLVLSKAETLTSQQHTEPVAGEVEVVAWTTPHMLDAMREPDTVLCGTIWPKKISGVPVALVTKSSYDALAAAKDAEVRWLLLAIENAARMAEQGVLSADGGLAALEIRSLVPLQYRALKDEGGAA